MIHWHFFKQSQGKEALEIEVAPVHDVDDAGLVYQQVEGEVGVEGSVELPVGVGVRVAGHSFVRSNVVDFAPVLDNY